jgi:putative flippase GtrA
MSAQRQIGGFVVAGVLATLTDALVYATLIGQGVPHNPAKATSFVVGSCVSWAMNRRVTFRSEAPPLREGLKFFALYGTTLTLNVAVNHLVLTLAPPSGWTATAAFVVATGCSATANFLGQRTWVFRGHTTRLSP